MSNDALKVKGCFRVQLTEDGDVVGDSGWTENAIHANGFKDYLQAIFSKEANSLQVGFITVGSGSAALTTTDNTLAGELKDVTNFRQAVTTSTSGSTSVSYTATFGSALLTVEHTGTQGIANIGLFNASLTDSATMFAGQTFTQSNWATNQSVNATYQITFS